MLSSSDDEGDSYSSDGDEGGLVIDSNIGGAGGEINQNGNHADALQFSAAPGSPKPELPWA